MAAPKTAKASQLEPRYVNTQQAAAMYGVSEATLINAAKAGALRAKRTGPNGGGRFLFTIAWLDAWVDGLPDA